MNRLFRAAAAFGAGLLLGGCQVEPRQWLVSVATDAPVPQLGDHLVLEVVGAGAGCTGCLRIIGVDQPSSLPVTFGVVPQQEGATVRIRARLYRAEMAGADGLPDSPALIDAVAVLPPLDGETRVPLNLSMRCFGVATALDERKTCDPATGTLAPEPVLAPLSDTAPQPRAGSWPIALPRPCAGSTPPGMVCVPGGAFILGTPRPGFAIDIDEESQPEHLAQISPFAIDQDEVTVGVVRDLVAKGLLDAAPVARKTSAPKSLQGACTYLGETDASNDALPINCISHSLAQAVCAALGKRLPREAEWEYAAGNLGDETPFPWGTGGDLCKMAILGVGRDFNEVDPNVFENAGCRPPGGDVPWGPVAGGQARDVTALAIRDLAGSMQEWVDDTFASYEAPCWQPTGTLLVDSECDAPAPGSAVSFSVRGSGWSSYKYQALATARSHELPPGSPGIGFRCVLPR